MKLRDRPHPDPLSLLVKVWPPMLATLSDEESVDPAKHVFEVKYDGFRALAGISNGKVTLQSRNGLDLSTRFPAVFRSLRKLAVSEAVLDGKIVALDEHGIASFQKLQNESSATKYFVFDLLWLDGEDLRARPLEERRDLLESVLANVADLPIALAERVSGGVHQILEAVHDRGGEGLIAKRKGSRYTGRRGREWLKVKVVRGQELAILGFTPISSGESMIGALHVGYREGGDWKWAGKVGTGYSDELRGALFRTLSRTKVAQSVASNAPRTRDTVWVRPTLVAQVAFTEWTDDGRLRHPVFHGLRADKSPDEVIRERPSTGSARAPRNHRAARAAKRRH